MDAVQPPRMMPIAVLSENGSIPATKIAATVGMPACRRYAGSSGYTSVLAVRGFHQQLPVRWNLLGSRQKAL